MGRERIQVYTDYKSPYAYVANRALFALEETHDVELDWYPYILRIEEYLGSLDERNAHQWRRVRYSYMDARRMANQQGLTLYGPQRVFEGYHAAAGLLFAKAGGFFRPYHDLVFDRFFKRDLDIDDPQQMAEAVASAGGDRAAYLAYSEGPGRDAVDRVVAEAEEQGVFGVPTLVLRGELFWGSERIPLLIQRLEG
ncbi:MAG: 2-hydroxychromene-2-carboxylate isomerase [Rhodospirillales bacterium]